MLHVIAHRVIKRRNGARVAGCAQFTNVGLREVLVFLADGRRHVHIFDARFPAQRRE